MDRLNDLLEAEKQMPRQGTPEWQAYRANVFGGSEYHKMITVRSARTMHTHIQSKYKDRGYVRAFVWGHLFEPVIEGDVSSIYNVAIHCKDAMFRGPIDGMVFSPDGIAVIVDPDGVENLVLFEFKCPISRIPSFTIPTQYVPQVQGGMDVLKCDYGIYAEAVYRICSEAVCTTKNAAINRYIHDVTDTPFIDPESCGRIWFVRQTDATLWGLSSALQESELYNPTSGYMDFGVVHNIDVIFQLINDGHIVASYGDKPANVFGVLCYKRFRLKVIKSMPEPDYLERHGVLKRIKIAMSAMPYDALTAPDLIDSKWNETYEIP